MEGFSFVIEPVKARMVDAKGNNLAHGVVVYKVELERNGVSRRAFAYFGGNTENKQVGSLYKEATPGFIAKDKSQEGFILFEDCDGNKVIA